MFFDFSEALKQLKDGKRVCRAGWNERGMWLSLVNEWHYAVTLYDAQGLHQLPWIGMKTVDNGFVPWLASQTDILASDWMVVES